MARGAANDNKGLFLTVAGGYFWNRKAETTDPNYAIQKFTFNEEEKERKGARFGDLTGIITGVVFKTHEKYGQNINVTLEDGEEKSIISIKTDNNRYSQTFMKFLLKADLTKEVYMKPYDFVGNDGKLAQGISFKQGGVKINLRNDDVPFKDAEWFKTASKKDKGRFFEDLVEWLVVEIEETVCPQFISNKVEDKPEVEQKEEAKPEVAKEEIEKPEVKKVTPLRMKKALKAYIAENYEGSELPTLTKEELVIWYNLSLEGEELPFVSFNEDDEPKADVSEGDLGDLDSQLDDLM